MFKRIFNEGTDVRSQSPRLGEVARRFSLEIFRVEHGVRRSRENFVTKFFNERERRRGVLPSGIEQLKSLYPTWTTSSRR